MTDREHRDKLLRELDARVTECRVAAQTRRYFGSIVPADDAERAAEYYRSADECERYAQHIEQAIVLVCHAEMPDEVTR